MRRQLSSIGRGALVSVCVVVALVAGFVLVTVVGIGDDEGAPPATTQAPRPAKRGTALQRYSEQVSRREAGLPAEAGGPPLSEEPPTAPKYFGRPIAQYKRYATGQSRRLSADVRRLSAAVRSGDQPRARSAWTIAFSRYLTLGAVYGLFGDLDADIDGRPGGLPRGVRDSGFRGLHRLELGLWTSEPVRSLQPVVDRLASDVARLPAAIEREPITPLDYSLRAHEILEDAQRDFLSGTDVPWSGEGVVATAAGLTATQVVMNTLRPLLVDKDAGITARAALARMRRVLDGIAAAHHGRLPALDGLRHDERVRLQAALGAALERLQLVPEALQTIDAPAIPRLNP